MDNLTLGIIYAVKHSGKTAKESAYPISESNFRKYETL